jgi:MFS family permease
MVELNSEDPYNPSYFFPIILAMIITFLIVRLMIYIYKTKISRGRSLSSMSMDELPDEYSKSLIDKKNSLKFRYLLAYILTRASIWSKSPYLYTMYSQYHGFSTSEIGVLYAIDAITALFSGPIFGNLADKFGRKLFCMLYCVLVCTNLSLRLTGNKTLAYLAQVCTGLGAGLIMTTFESWVNYEAKKDFGEHKLAKERFLKRLFKIQTLYDAICSIVVAAFTAIIYTKLGILAPIFVSIILSASGGTIILLYWAENKPDSVSGSRITSFTNAIKELKKREVLSIGIMESLFQACIHLFIFSWTPILQSTTDDGRMNIGFIFVCFVFTTIIATTIFDLLVINMKAGLYGSMCALLFINMTIFYLIYVVDSFFARLIMLACINVYFYNLNYRDQEVFISL